jgi:hypothetical protein
MAYSGSNVSSSEVLPGADLAGNPRPFDGKFRWQYKEDIYPHTGK